MGRRGEGEGDGTLTSIWGKLDQRISVLHHDCCDVLVGRKARRLRKGCRGYGHCPRRREARIRLWKDLQGEFDSVLPVSYRSKTLTVLSLVQTVTIAACGTC